MALLVVGVVLAAALGLLNLMIVLSIMRRLRERAEVPTDSRRAPIIPAGLTVANFATTTVSGAAVSRAALTGPTLVGFFEEDCGPCDAALPRFVATAGAYRKARVLAVVIAADDNPETNLVARLRQVGDVVREQRGSTLQAAFRVAAHPVFAVVEPGGVVRSSYAEVTDTAEVDVPRQRPRH